MLLNLDAILIASAVPERFLPTTKYAAAHAIGEWKPRHRCSANRLKYQCANTLQPYLQMVPWNAVIAQKMAGEPGGTRRTVRTSCI
jgi:hypothetical protein